MDEARRDEIRGRLDRPHTRDALAPLVTASELRALLDALEAAEREHATVLASLTHALAQGDALRAEAKDLHDRMTDAEVRATRLRAHDVESVRQLRADCERLAVDCDVATAERDDAREDLARIGRLVGCDSLVGVEIHAAVEHVVRFELEAARDAAERAERERDDARAEVETLRAEAALMREKLAAHARHTDAAVDGVRAMLPAALDLARREGAEAMREWAANACERMVVGGCAWSEEQATAARALLDAAGNVRALPLDAPGGES
jgi:predicted  nucleic acid-binding Zn-ribbon protein